MDVREKMTFCTLFDSNYLDKGLALYSSMREHIKHFKLYIFAFDEKSFEVLSDMRLKNTVIISVEDIMTDRLREIRQERTRAEFCWTCSSVIIEHVLLKRGERICTYIDADIYFFASPIGIIDEIMDSKCSVGLVRHGFERDYEYGRWIFGVGKYCIQFNTFLNNEEGIAVLSEWKENCLDWCFNRLEDGKLGDQKYPDKWKQKYDCIHEIQNLGAGVAPWNLHLYSYAGKRGNVIWMRHRHTRFPLIFYHFEAMKYLTRNRVYLNLWRPEGLAARKKARMLYGEYMKKLESARGYLTKQYGVKFDHMVVSEDSPVFNRHSLNDFCSECGLLGGLSRWMGFWTNNVMKTGGLLK